MKQFYTLALALVAITVFAQDGAPATPYYNGFNFEQTGTALKNALANKITTTHVNLLTYQEVENALMVVDLDPEDNSNTNLLLVYGFSDTMCPASTGDDEDHRRRNKNMDDDGTASPCLWNREHTYPRALGNPDLGTSGPGADAHHVRASDKKRNASRDNNKYFDGTGNSFESGQFWYPGDEWKGDIARMMMYMYLRYGSQCLPTNVGVGTPVASDANMIDLFLEWNAEDPVSEYEDNRNAYLGNANNAYGQGNRNPFIDNPYLATMIWGGPVAQDRWGIAGTDEVFTAQLSVYPNPATDHEVNIYSETTLEEIQLINLNGQLIQYIQQPKAENNTYTLDNLPQGFYILKVTSGNQSATKKVIVN
ncbi:T9SS type A sorting domain-containing protein [Flavobacterium salilacus subsp. salilacus]|uniref:endonuclease n=1 Tax=Flavobacterium TaxID=237 RepID=UPI001075493E|nr:MULTISPECIES: endonuclease [Flavobacterium]KAF2518761.1 T9SS type A sorting domain-containing protein [Flavobacterium salilacus subsp. salilacus]MBE1613729.1 endonuclease [Flavobacterium sp. SaA2.13]